MSCRAMTAATWAVGLLVMVVGLAARAGEALPGFALIPAGEFEMGD